MNRRAYCRFILQQRHLSRAFYAGVVNVTDTQVAIFVTYEMAVRQGRVWDLRGKKPKGGEIRINQGEPATPELTFSTLWTEWKMEKPFWNLYRGTVIVNPRAHKEAPREEARVRALLHVYQGPFIAYKEFPLS